MKVSVAQLCPTLCNTMDCSPLGSSVHGILQARILEWVVMPFSRESSQPGDWSWVFHFAGRFFTIWATRELLTRSYSSSLFSFFIFWENYTLFLMWLNQFIFLLTVYKCSLYSMSSSALTMSCLFVNIHSTGVLEVIFHCSFDLHFSDDCLRRPYK